MVGRDRVPNVIDAVIICRYLRIGVESIWGPAADEQLAKAGAPLLKVKAASPDAAAEQALAEAIDEVKQIRASARQDNAKPRGKNRKSG